VRDDPEWLGDDTPADSSASVTDWITDDDGALESRCGQLHVD
jgi:hypothetical protein